MTWKQLLYSPDIKYANETSKNKSPKINLNKMAIFNLQASKSKYIHRDENKSITEKKNQGNVCGVKTYNRDLTKYQVLQHVNSDDYTILVL